MMKKKRKKYEEEEEEETDDDDEEEEEEKNEKEEEEQNFTSSDLSRLVPVTRLGGEENCRNGIVRPRILLCVHSTSYDMPIHVVSTVPEGKLIVVH